MFALSDEAARDGLTLRPAEPGDRAFFRALFATTRLDAPILAQWPAAERDRFLDSQFQFQDQHYRGVYAAADFLVIAQHGAPAGRLILERGAETWLIVDIGLLPQLRGRGLGETLLKAIQRGAAAAGAASVTLNVEVGNRARDLYTRLGFAETDDSGTHIAMEWRSS